MSNAEFFREQAAKDLRLAGETMLPSVRERCERSAAAWNVMAERHQKQQDERAVRLADKSA